jgi:hypothetical protein
MKLNFTQAQLVALVGWIAAQAVAYGYMSSVQSQIALSAAGTVIAAVWSAVHAWKHTTDTKVVGRKLD